MNETLRVRHLVIGSGAGGAVAAFLSSKKGDGVLVVEEGMDNATLLPPYTQNKLMSGMWREGGVIPIESNASFVFAEGRTVGGSTMVNAGIMHRLPEERRVAWEHDHQLKAFSERDLSPFCDEVDHRLARPADNTSPIASLFARGAEATGHSTVAPPSSIERTADGTLRKLGMRSTYLADAVANGARIMPNCRVQKILFEGYRAIAADAFVTEPDGSVAKLRISFDRLTVACGAIQTPVLLRRSGITRGIGDTLKFHPTVRVLAAFDRPLNGWISPMPTLQMKDLAPEISCGISLSLPPMLASSFSYHWQQQGLTPADLPHLGMFYAMTVSHGNGRVRPIPFTSSYRARYDLTTTDLQELTKGISILGRLLFEAGATTLFPGLKKTPRFGSSKELPDVSQAIYRANDLFAMSIHAFASCPMGETSDCPIDSFGCLKGTENVTLADASILPDAPGVNPQGTIMALVLRNETLRP